MRFVFSLRFNRTQIHCCERFVLSFLVLMMIYLLLLSDTALPTPCSLRRHECGNVRIANGRMCTSIAQATPPAHIPSSKGQGQTPRLVFKREGEMEMFVLVIFHSRASDEGNYQLYLFYLNSY